ncbi:MAG: DUF3047 domain-containing protein [Candidatus Rokuibacteriota bacterium]
MKHHTRIAAAVAGCLVVATGPWAGRPGLTADCRVVSDLAHARPGAFPPDWKPREEGAREIYQVLEDGGVRFVRATAKGTGIQMGKEFDWDLRTHPVLTWKWRPRVFPTGGDERDGGKNDSAVGVYAVFPHSPVSVKAVKYVWSLAAPVGTTASASRGLTRMVVLRSGKPAGEAWVEERVNAAQDYQRLFGEAPKRPRGIAVLTDSDDTRSVAVGDYTAFRVCAAG